jgi:hypothetical protein
MYLCVLYDSHNKPQSSPEQHSPFCLCNTDAVFPDVQTEFFNIKLQALKG